MSKDFGLPQKEIDRKLVEIQKDIESYNSSISVGVTTISMLANINNKIQKIRDNLKYE